MTEPYDYSEPPVAQLRIGPPSSCPPSPMSEAPDLEPEEGESSSSPDVLLSPPAFAKEAASNPSKAGGTDGGGAQRVLTTPTSTSVVPDPFFESARNAAMVLIKPNINVAPVRNYVKDRLLLMLPGCHLSLDADVSGERVGREKVLDRHYRETAAYAMHVAPGELKVDVDAFKKTFGEEWSSVVSSKRVLNAMQALTRLECDPARLGVAWREAATRSPKSYVIRLGPNLYCGLLSVRDASLYVINGFYMEARGRYAHPKALARVIVVQWDEKAVSWEDFRTKVAGCTAVSESMTRKAPEGSIRKLLWEKREKLCIGSELIDGRWDDDGLHVAASPLEALAERCNWLGHSPADDIWFGRALLGRGVPESKVVDWFENPIVMVPPPPPPSYSDGTIVKKSIFEAVRDLDAAACLKRLVEIYDCELFYPDPSDAGCGCAIS